MNNDEKNVSFWDVYSFICKIHGVAPTTVLKEIGISTSVIQNWKADTSPTKVTIRKITERFEADPDLIVGLMQGLRSENDKTRDYYFDNWKKFIITSFPNAPLAAEAKDCDFLISDDIDAISGIIAEIQTRIAEIEKHLQKIKDRQ